MTAGIVYLVRHCTATAQPGAGPQADAPLTPAGALAAFLTTQPGPPIRRLVSSPYRRALDTATPLAAGLGRRVEPEPRLAERVLGDPAGADWGAWRRPAWTAAEVLYPGDADCRGALSEALAAVAELVAFARADAGGQQAAVAVTHGNLLAWLLLQLDPRVGSAQGLRPSTPDVYRLAVTAAGTDVRRLWRDA